MKTKFILLQTSCFLFSIELSSQSLLKPNKGQFFEQGYGQSSTWKGNEEGIDLVFDQSFNNIGGALMAGWVEDTSEIYDSYGDNVLNAAVWRIGAFGKQRFHFSISGNLNEAATGIINGPANKYAICVRKSVAYNSPETVEIGDSLLVYQFDSLGEIDFVLRYGFTLEGYESTGIAPVDIIYEGEGIYLILANRIYLQEIGNKIEPVLLRVDQDGDIIDLEIYNGYDNSVEAHELFKDQSANIFYSANSLGDTPYPMFFRYNNSLVNQTLKAYSSITNTQVFGLAKHPFGYFAMSGYQVSESDTNAVIITLDEDFSYDQTWSVGLENLTETFRDLNTHAEGIVAVGLRQSNEELGIGEGQKDIFICHFDNTGEITLEETMGSHKNDRVTHTEPHPLQPATFFAGNHTGYGKDSTGNAYLGGVLFSDVESLISGNCEVPRVLWVDSMIKRPETAIGIILGNKQRENDLIQFALDNQITSLALFNLGLIFDNHNNQHQYILDSKVELQDSLKSFIAKCFNNGIEVGMVTDTTNPAQINASLYNAGLFNFQQSSKIRFMVLEHEFWNAQSIYAQSGITMGINPALIDPNDQNDHFESVWNDHKVNIQRLNNLKNTSANVWMVYDYIGFLYHRWDPREPPLNGSLSLNSYWHTNLDSQQTKASYLETHTDAIFLHYYTPNQYNDGLDFLNSSLSSAPDVPRFMERLAQFGQQSNLTHIIPIFSGEFYINSSSFCGDGSSTDYLGKFLDPTQGQNLRAVEQEYIDQHAVIFANTTQFPNIENVNMLQLSWFKYSCLKDYDFKAYQGQYSNRLHACPDFTFDPTVETIELVSNSNIIVYPNPAESELNFISQERLEYLVLFDISGKKIIEKSVVFSNKLDLTGVKSGVYFLKIVSKSKTETFKIVKQ